MGKLGEEFWRLGRRQQVPLHLQNQQAVYLELISVISQIDFPDIMLQHRHRMMYRTISYGPSNTSQISDNGAKVQNL